MKKNVFEMNETQNVHPLSLIEQTNSLFYVLNKEFGREKMTLISRWRNDLNKSFFAWKLYKYKEQSVLFIILLRVVLRFS